MTHPAYLREKARRLRIERRLTLDEIAERLALPKTTVWYWIADLPIERTSRQTAAQRRATTSMQRRFRRLRNAALEAGREEFAGLCSDSTFRDFVCLYIAEGYKRNRNVVSVCNSDPAVIKLADRWIRRFASNAVTYKVQYHADQDAERLQSFWARELNVDPVLIRLLPKSNSGSLRSRTWRCEHGVMAVTTNDTLFRARLEAWIGCLRSHWLHSTAHGA